MSTKNYRILSQIYRKIKNSVSYTSVKNLYDEAKKYEPGIKLKDVKLWLSG